MNRILSTSKYNHYWWSKKFQQLCKQNSCFLISSKWILQLSLFLCDCLYVLEYIEKYLKYRYKTKTICLWGFCLELINITGFMKWKSSLNWRYISCLIYFNQYKCDESNDQCSQQKLDIKLKDTTTSFSLFLNYRWKVSENFYSHALHNIQEPSRIFFTLRKTKKHFAVPEANRSKIV